MSLTRLNHDLEETNVDVFDGTENEPKNQVDDSDMIPFPISFSPVKVRVLNWHLFCSKLCEAMLYT